MENNVCILQPIQGTEINKIPLGAEEQVRGIVPATQERLVRLRTTKPINTVSAKSLPLKHKAESLQKISELANNNESSFHATKADTSIGSKNKAPSNSDEKQDGGPRSQKSPIGIKGLDKLDLSAITVKEDPDDDPCDLSSIREDFPEWEYKRKVEVVPSSNPHVYSSSVISFPSFWAYVKSLNLSKEKLLTTVQKLSFLEKITMSCSTAARLPVSLANEKDQIIAFSAVPYDPKNPLHFNVLRTIYVKLTGNYNCPAKGAHWELIGFTRDPAKDLRSVGMLGLLQILAFLNIYESFIKEAYEFSTKDLNRPPLCSSLLGATLITIELAKTSKLNQMIMNQRSAINAINNVYFAIFYNIYKECREKERQAVNSYTSIYRQIKKAAQKDPRALVETFNQGIQEFNAARGLL